MVTGLLLQLRHRCGLPGRAVASVAAVAVIAAVLAAAQDASALVQPQPSRPAADTIAAGTNHSCAIRVDGTIVCWGANPYGQTDAPGGTFTAVSAGTYHSCAIRTDGTVVCWGDNPYGQIDAPSGPFSDVAAGRGYSCGIRTDSTAVCWGAQTWGLSDAPDGAFTGVAAGRLYSCGIRPDHTLTCWGNSGWLSDVPDGTFVDVALGWDHSCGVRTDGTVSCWGVNFGGQRDAPSGTFIDVGVGANYSCAVQSDGNVVCWGDNSYGRAEAPSGTFTAVAAGEFHACGLRTDNAILCWGWDEYGLADAPGGQFGPPTQHTPDSTATGDTSTGEREITGDTDADIDDCIAAYGADACNGDGARVIHIFETPIDDPEAADTTAGAAGSGPDAEAPAPGDADREREITGDTVTDWDGVSVIHIFETPIDDPEAADTTTRPVTGSVPGAVRGLVATPQPDGVEVRWSAPADVGGSPITHYEVEYSREALYYHPDHGNRDRWHISKTVRGTSHIYGRLLSGVTYTVKVRALNRVGAGRITTADFETLARPNAPRSVQATPLHDGGVEVTWSAPPDDGGSPITHYEVEYSRPALHDHPDHGSRDPWHITKTARGTSHIYRRLLPDVTYTVTVRAVNGVGAGPSTTGRVFATRQPCPTGDKFKVDRTGFLWRHKRVVALRDFTTINNIEVEAGTRGGKVSDKTSLSQSGCSWIFNDAEVSDDAQVSDNAVVSGNARVSDDARIYGDARVHGDARIYDDAAVYGDASVFGDARIYGDARVHGSARVHGESKVHGDAELFGTAEFNSLQADKERFDGHQEHQRAGRELYRAMHAHFTDKLIECDRPLDVYRESDIPDIVYSLLNKDRNNEERQVSEALLIVCREVIALREVTGFFLPSWWDLIFPIAKSLSALRRSYYITSLIEFVEMAKPLRDLSQIPNAARMWDAFEHCDQSCFEPR